MTRSDDLRFLNDLTGALNRSLETGEILEVLSGALERFDLATLCVLPSHPTGGEGHATLHAFGGRRVQIYTMLSGWGAAALGVRPGAFSVEHRPRPEWPSAQPDEAPIVLPGGGGRVPMTLELGRALDEEERLLISEVAKLLITPLANAHRLRRALESREALQETIRTLGRTQADLIAAEKLASVGQLAAGVAHEINNPLAFVISNLNVLREYARDLRQLLAHYRAGETEAIAQLELRADPDFMLTDLEVLVGESLQGAERVHRIVRELRSFTRGWSDELLRDEVDLTSMVESVLTVLRGQLRARAELVEALVEVPPVRGDRGRLSQVVINLLMNALQSIPAGRPGRIGIRLVTDGALVGVEISDNGVGIGGEHLERVFEPFYTTKEAGCGSGLGLAISDDIARRHGGHIEVRSVLGEGSAFTMWLSARSTQPMPRVSVEPGPPEERLGRVLFIDDERFLLNAYRRTFHGFAEVLTALGGEEGIRRLESIEQIDLILCDLIMPRVNGADVFEWVGTHRPELLDRLVIATAAHRSPLEDVLLERLDSPVVHKPIDRRALTELMRARGLG